MVVWIEVRVGLTSIATLSLDNVSASAHVVREPTANTRQHHMVVCIEEEFGQTP